MCLSSLKSLVVALSLPSTSAALAHVVSSGVPGMIFEHDVPITMNDGLKLRVNIYRPQKPGYYPVLMQQKIAAGLGGTPLSVSLKGLFLNSCDRGAA